MFKIRLRLQVPSAEKWTFIFIYIYILHIGREIFKTMSAEQTEIHFYLYR